MRQWYKFEYFNFILEQCFFFIFLRDKTDYMTTQTQKNNIEHFKNILKSHSLKATPQRLAVHEAMLKLGHASADMVTEEIQKSSGTKVTVASVYNILTSMAMLGIYHHRLSSNNKMYFDVNTFRHFHIYDCENHQYRDVVDNDLAYQEKEGPVTLHFPKPLRPTGNRVNARVSPHLSARL